MRLLLCHYFGCQFESGRICFQIIVLNAHTKQNQKKIRFHQWEEILIEWIGWAAERIDSVCLSCWQMKPTNCNHLKNIIDFKPKSKRRTILNSNRRDRWTTAENTQRKRKETRKIYTERIRQSGSGNSGDGGGDVSGSGSRKQKNDLHWVFRFIFLFRSHTDLPSLRFLMSLRVIVAVRLSVFCCWFFCVFFFYFI